MMDKLVEMSRMRKSTLQIAIEVQYANVVRHALLYSEELELSNGTTLIFVSPLRDNMQPHLICRRYSYVSKLVRPHRFKVVYQMTFHDIP